MPFRVVKGGFFGEELYFTYMTKPKVPIFAAIKGIFSALKLV